MSRTIRSSPCSIRSIEAGTIRTSAGRGGGVEEEGEETKLATHNLIVNKEVSSREPGASPTPQKTKASTHTHKPRPPPIPIHLFPPVHIAVAYVNSSRVKFFSCPTRTEVGTVDFIVINKVSPRLTPHT